MVDEPTLLWDRLILFFKYYKAKISKYYGAYDLIWLKNLNNKQVPAALYALFTNFVMSKRLLVVSWDRAFSVVICYLNLDNSNFVWIMSKNAHADDILSRKGSLYRLAWALLISQSGQSRAKVGNKLKFPRL